MTSSPMIAWRDPDLDRSQHPRRGARAYDAYAAAIRQEFIHVPERDYRAGRAKVLGQFAAGRSSFPMRLCREI
jgi:Uncharacterized protein conserved in bacteria